jgi:hypothetical protein
MNDLLENPNYFYCEKLHCKLKLQVCLGRQKANAQRKSLEPLPFPECSQCGQGERNKPLISGKPEQGNPQSGQGRRYEDCDLYEDCLDHAVTEDWENFHCEACPLNQSKEEKPTMTESPKPENARICEDCKERPTMRPNFPLCASCMAKRSNKPRAPSTKKRKEKKIYLVKVALQKEV